MKTTILRWRGGAWDGVDPAGAGADLVVWFAAPDFGTAPELYRTLRAAFPRALIAGCSTGGEIVGDEVLEGGAVAAAVSFDMARVQGGQVWITPGDDASDLGARLAESLAAPDLRSIYVLSDGLQVNGTALIEGLTRVLPNEVVVTGGLAGDGAAFGETRVGLDSSLAPGSIVAVGFYGDSLRVGWGSAGGWELFGPQRMITASDKNVLFELDGKPALELYKKFLGPAAAQLPGSALLFPLAIRPEPGSPYDLVRTIVGVDEERGSLIFAGDVPAGWTAQLMRGSTDGLADGAAEAARQANAGESAGGALALLVSCIGRKLMMGQRVSDEVESAADQLGDAAMLGFYSYGEISPHGLTGACALHNQTMTITVVREAA